MKVLCKTTIEITDQEIDKIYKLFAEVFHLQRDRQTFREEYQNTPLGYSYHSILYDDKEEVVGFHSCMPFYYLCEDKRFLVGLGTDSMVAKQHRDFFNFCDLVTTCEKRLKADGFSLRIGFPNDNSYPVLVKGMRHKDIGKLDTYCLVRNVSGVKSKLKPLNFLSQLYGKCQAEISRFSTNKTVYDFKYHKDRESFDKVRYRWFGTEYSFIREKGFEAVYRVSKYKGVQTAFLLDVYPLSAYNFDKAVREIYRREHKWIDMVLYVGKLPFSPLSMIKIPRKFEPKNFNFTCKPLVKGEFDDSLYDIRNWDVNLSNYDLI